MKYVLMILLVASLLNSCNKKAIDVTKIYTAEEFAQLASKATSVNPTGENAIPFSDYTLGVKKENSKTLIFERLKFYAVEFESEKMARSEALRLNQYYSRNILFDKVEGEPILEDYLIETFKAVNPNRAVQRVPKKAEDHGEHGAEAPHSEAHSTHQ